MTKWLSFSFFMWVIGLGLGSIPVGTSLYDNKTITAPINSTMSYTQAYSNQDWLQMVSPMFHLDYFSSWLKIVTLDLPLFGPPNDPMQLLRWIFLGPVIATIVYGFVLGLIAIFSYVLG